MRFPKAIRLNPKSRRGISQVEVAVSSLIVGVLMVACFSAVAASRRSQVYESNRVRGLAIAEALVSEITQLPMRDPSCDCGWGPGNEELGSNRMNFDDVDDYRDLIDSPPRSRSGVLLTGYSDLSRRVAIDRVANSNWNSVTNTYAGVYRITVRVLRGSSEVCRLVVYRTSGSQGTTAIANFSSLN